MRTNKRVSAIVIKDNKILLIHRRKEGREYWVVPGGGVEEGEGLEQGLIREVKEETGLDLIRYNLIAQNTEDEIEHYFYICELSKGEPVLGGPEAEDNNKDNWYHLEWMSKDKLSNLSLYPKHIKEIMNEILNSL